MTIIKEVYEAVADGIAWHYWDALKVFIVVGGLWHLVDFLQ